MVGPPGEMGPTIRSDALNQTAALDFLGRALTRAGFENLLPRAKTHH